MDRCKSYCANITGMQMSEEKGLPWAYNTRITTCILAKVPTAHHIADLQSNRYMGVCVQIKAVQEYLKELLESTDQKLLVFAHHKDLLDGIEFTMNK